MCPRRSSLAAALACLACLASCSFLRARSGPEFACTDRWPAPAIDGSAAVATFLAVESVRCDLGENCYFTKELITLETTVIVAFLASAAYGVHYAVTRCPAKRPATQ